LSVDILFKGLFKEEGDCVKLSLSKTRSSSSLRVGGPRLPWVVELLREELVDLPYDCRREAFDEFVLLARDAALPSLGRLELCLDLLVRLLLVLSLGLSPGDRVRILDNGGPVRLPLATVV
jgi:hypothetical protein